MKTLKTDPRPTQLRPERRRLEKAHQGSRLQNTWKHLHPRIDTRRKLPQPDLLRLETPPESPHQTLVTPDLETRIKPPSSPVILHRKLNRTYRAFLRTTHSSLESKSRPH
ncbi:hypothetical protein HID58_017357 [Brassica napus]|uniref:Uncharacterized protein n=1 Tax=Brassica napus TaxID=3708 RepID=A0ABQ8D9P2_BRANA|nr:hypothetical protein HID58_017357 [Brassica napus]